MLPAAACIIVFDFPRGARKIEHAHKLSTAVPERRRGAAEGKKQLTAQILSWMILEYEPTAKTLSIGRIIALKTRL